MNNFHKLFIESMLKWDMIGRVGTMVFYCDIACFNYHNVDTNPVYD